MAVSGAQSVSRWSLEATDSPSQRSPAIANSPRIGVAARDPHLIALLLLLLEKEGFAPLELCDPHYDLWPQASLPDLVIVETDENGRDAIDHKQRLRRLTEVFPLPVLALVPQLADRATLECFDAGIDDVMELPLRSRELVARIRRILWRLRPDLAACVSKNMTPLLSPGPGEISCCGSKIHLPPAEIRLLGVFLRKPERVLSREEIVRDMYGRRSTDPRTVDAYVKRLRQALQCGRRINPIRTVRSVGYMFEPVSGTDPIDWKVD